MYHYILFDLDGTLTDSKAGVLHSLRYAFEKLGEPIPPDSFLTQFIGPPMQVSFPEFCGYDAEKTQLATKLFKEHYEPVGLFENTPAPGLAELCARLKAQGYVLGVASSKPEHQCVAVCDKFGFSPSFTAIAGSAPGLDSEKKVVIQDALRRMNVPDDDRSEVLMVGDRKFDVLGAGECGIDCVGVEFFGYAEPGELEQAGAIAVVQTADELEQFILSH